jgi:hypothetical protein
MKKFFLQIFFLCSLNTAVATECCNNQINDQIKRQKEVKLQFEHALNEFVQVDASPIAVAVIATAESLRLLRKKANLPLAVALSFGSGVILFLKYYWRASTWKRVEMAHQLQCELNRLNNDKKNEVRK